jgi:hypothetical protein
VRAISPLSADGQAKVGIAAAFHDLCAFGGMDYLEPSIEEAARYLRETGREAWDREVALMIASSPDPSLSGDAVHLVEPSRRADWNDFTMGLVRGGIPRELRKAADTEFPVTAFIPKAVLVGTIAWLPRHPLRPAPPFRGGAALRRTGRA